MDITPPKDASKPRHEKRPRALEFDAEEQPDHKTPRVTLSPEPFLDPLDLFCYEEDL